LEIVAQTRRQAIAGFSFGQYDDDMSFSETIFLFVLALVIFGPKKLPEIARQIGKYLNEFKRASNEFKAQIEQEISNLEVEKKPALITTTHAPEGTTSRSLNPAATEAVAGEPPASEPVNATLAAAPETSLSEHTYRESTSSESTSTEHVSSELILSEPVSSEPATSEPQIASHESNSLADPVISSEPHA
jgi:sec-independent protein translocase protein TatB